MVHRKGWQWKHSVIPYHKSNAPQTLYGRLDLVSPNAVQSVRSAGQKKYIAVRGTWSNLWCTWNYDLSSAEIWLRNISVNRREANGYCFLWREEHSLTYEWNSFSVSSVVILMRPWSSLTHSRVIDACDGKKFFDINKLNYMRFNCTWRMWWKHLKNGSFRLRGHLDAYRSYCTKNYIHTRGNYTIQNGEYP